ncbi:hypothetical protein BV898_15089 [Hypsibius exemplaris]|uniref:Uncharacterized protein n=1 Tax=Hypsibius exemplaris TaxID=2072580 RepID=A0A9X6NCB8_HYPEX|nr:hypothetical protein BV898_15089 [Hypsibius exemplaris]
MWSYIEFGGVGVDRPRGDRVKCGAPTAIHGINEMRNRIGCIVIGQPIETRGLRFSFTIFSSFHPHRRGSSAKAYT